MGEGLRHLVGRPMMKGDVEFVSKNRGLHKYTSTCVLHCVGGAQYWGQEQQLKEDAEKSAALIAWQAIKDQVEAKKAEPKQKPTLQERRAKKLELQATGVVDP